MEKKYQITSYQLVYASGGRDTVKLYRTAMNPYIVQGVTLVFYDGEREELSVLDSKITDRPPKLLKEQILDGFSRMENPPVKVELKIKYL